MALLISLLATGFSGLKVYGLEGHGPLATSTYSVAAQQTPVQTQAASGLIKVSYSEAEEAHEAQGGNEADEEFWEEIHEFFANFTLLLVFLHVGGVIASSVKHGQNLARAMITGYKQKNKGQFHQPRYN